MKTNVSSYGQTIVIRWSKKPMWIFRKLNKLNFILNTHSNIHTDDKKVVRKEKSCFTFQLIEKKSKNHISLYLYHNVISYIDDIRYWHFANKFPPNLFYWGILPKVKYQQHYNHHGTLSKNSQILKIDKMMFEWC